MTVEEICSEAGVGRTTFYLHFESKERLLASFAGATAAGVAADLDEARDADTLDEQLDVLIRGVVRRMQAVPKSLAQLVIQSQRVGLMKVSADEFVELDPVRRPAPGRAHRRAAAGGAGPCGRPGGAG